MDNDLNKRGSWSSKFTFILVASGSAIGLGNIWRFPYLTGMNGGAAFVLIYLSAVFTIGLALLLAETSIGRAAKGAPVCAFKRLKPNSGWHLLGVAGVITCTVILSYYTVIAGWTLGYSFKALKGDFSKSLTTEMVKGMFASFSSNTGLIILLFFIFIFITVLIVAKGVSKGIEKTVKSLMPILLLILIYLVIKSVSAKGASEGLNFFLKPDFSKVTWDTVLLAITQAFFSLSVGIGIMLTYGSYLSKKESLVSAGFWIVSLDTIVALMAGLIIFPTLFAVPGMVPTEGPPLVFIVLPLVFSKIAGGAIFGFLFFLLLVVAALTSTISLLEVVVAYCVDTRKWARKKAAYIVGLFIIFIGIPSILSQGGSNFFSSLPVIKKPFLDVVDLIFGTYGYMFGALLITIFVGYVWGTNSAINEIEKCGRIFKLKRIWSFVIKWIMPLLLSVILIASFI